MEMLNISIKMSGQAEPYEEYESVDLTEDELSSEENFADESNPVNFVDGSAAFATPPLPPLTPIRNIVCPQYPMEAVGHKNSPNILKKHETKFSQPTTSQRKVEIGKSFQNKPSVSTLVNTQDILKLSTSTTMESACIAPNSGKVGSILPKPQIVHVKHISNESQNQTIYSQKQPGKVVIIKKNNKFYKIVIPHNVMPNINQSTGPVLINIPEVGPLVISNDPRVTKPNSTPINQPFSLNLDDTHQTRPKIPIPLVKEPKKIPEVSAKEAALSNKKFCWTYCKRRKRDLEGFTFNDRLGFNQSECKKATKCSRTLDSIISKKRTQLINQMYKYNKFKDSVIKNNEVKLIKINAIVGETSKQKRIITSKFEPDKNISPPPNKYSKKRNKTASESKSYDLQNIRFSANEMEQDTDYGGDLLLTKKSCNFE
ncbi:hypothetical protein NQ314_020900 [Rhamnusium bicolor]|uniref:Uncharacterized protein n=1 Tax=Rhamnusium bicolor TaxID=1586634 RepID=A0AAV8WKD8_9CUCU|nr:hypothetical protein NQ314_020900 [Rhamnusium bicolor]